MGVETSTSTSTSTGLSIEQLVDDFVKNYAPKSQKFVRWLLKKFFDVANISVEKFISLNPQEASLIINSVKNYYVGKKQHGLAVCVQRISRSLYAYANRVKLYFLPGEKVRVVEKEKPVVGFADIKAIAREMRRVGRGIAGLRNQTMCLVMLYSGVRIGAACNLKYLHVKDQLHEQYITLRITPTEDTKLRRSYTTFLAPEAAKALRNYIRYRMMVQGWKPKLGDPLFPGKGNRPLFADTFRRAFKRAALRVLGVKITPHAIRRCFHMALVFSEIPFEAKESLMGHTFGVPQHYTMFTAQQLLQYYKKVFPPSSPGPDLGPDLGPDRV